MLHVVVLWYVTNYQSRVSPPVKNCFQFLCTFSLDVHLQRLGFFFLLVVISTLPSVSALKELMPTLMLMEFILDLSIPLIPSAERLSLDLTVILKC
jgi:hypothetical protein